MKQNSTRKLERRYYATPFELFKKSFVDQNPFYGKSHYKALRRDKDSGVVVTSKFLEHTLMV